VLVASRHGLFAWSPVYGLALAGWVLLAREPQTRGLGMACLAGFAIQWVLNALPVDWWAGWSFGARRFVDVVPLVVMGLGILAERQRFRLTIWILVALELVQWLRVASRALSGEADPGWGGLWGAGFVRFLPQAPAAAWRVLATSWTSLQVLRRPQAVPPDLHTDPTWVLAVLYVGWCAGVLLAYRALSRRRSAASAR
jgi:hypothetical protein